MSETKDFVCKITPELIEDWVQSGPEEECHPCLVAPLSSYYLGTLEKAGEKKLAEELTQVFEEGDMLTISKKLDNIKNNVGEALRKQLINLDCFAQTFKPNDASK